MTPSIVILGSYPPPYGGIATHLKHFIPHLLKQNYQVRVVASGERFEVEQVNGFHVHRMTKDRIHNFRLLLPQLPRLASSFFRQPFPALDFLKAQAIFSIAEPLIQNAQLICAYHLLPWGLAGAWLSEKYKLPFLCANFGEIHSNPAFYRRHLKQIQYIARQAKHLVSSSHHCARGLSLIGIHKPVETIYIGVDTQLFSPNNDPKKIRARFGIPENVPLVLFVGRLIRDMGLHTLLEAIPLFNSKAATLIVGADGKLADESRKLAVRYPGRVFVCTDTPFSELPFYYSAADLFVAPSPDNRSCGGLAIEEAMATAKPVVACRVGGIPETVVDGETGLLIPPEKPHQLAVAIQKLLDDPAARLKMGEAGRQRAIELFSLETTNRLMEQAYRRAMKETMDKTNGR
ncbi:MAG: glycosyltransferase family 4 protein [Elusimicrobia bacterium]|nr:glycosyltransferase family 4 protein [Elusimicrobiota bacterium]